MIHSILCTSKRNIPAPGVYYNKILGLFTASSDGVDRVTCMDKNLGATQVWHFGDEFSQEKSGTENVPHIYQVGYGSDYQAYPPLKVFQGDCPEGFHIPNREEFEKLLYRRSICSTKTDTGNKTNDVSIDLFLPIDWDRGGAQYGLLYGSRRFMRIDTNNSLGMAMDDGSGWQGGREWMRPFKDVPVVPYDKAWKLINT